MKVGKLWIKYYYYEINGGNKNYNALQGIQDGIVVNNIMIEALSTNQRWSKEIKD